MALALLRLCGRQASVPVPEASYCRYSLSTSAWSSVKSWLLPWPCRSFGNSERIPCSSRGGRRRVRQPLCCLVVFGLFSESGWPELFQVESLQASLPHIALPRRQHLFGHDVSEKSQGNDARHDVFPAHAGEDSAVCPR